MWALAAALPFLLVAVRTLTERGGTFLEGDLALLHVDSLRAARLHLLLGPYDRFGWHHPGPVYGYLISLADRLLGYTRPLQAEALAAIVVDGASLAGAVALARRHLGPGPAAGLLALGGVTLTGLGNDAVFNPWPPTVVVLPLVLLGVMTLAALADGSVGVLLGAVLAGTFSVQTDVGTLPYVAVAVAVTAGSVLWPGRARRRPGSAAARIDRLVPAGWSAATSRTALALGVVVAVLAWIPVGVQELASRHGNLTELFDFFRASHSHAGLGAGVRAAGWAQLAVFGHRPPGAPPVGSAGSWALLLIAASAVALVVAAAVRRRPVAAAGAAFWLVGTAVSVAAGAEIVGPPYAYLTYWAAAPLAGAAVALGDLLLGDLHLGGPGRPAAVREKVGPDRDGAPVREAALLVLAAAGTLALGVHLVQRRAVSSYSPAAVAVAWAEVSPALSGGEAVGVAYPDEAGTWNIGTGLVDRLESTGHPVAVLAFWSNQVTATTRDPARWLSVVPSGVPVPAGVERLGSAGGDLLVFSRRPVVAGGGPDGPGRRAGRH